jgi:4-hydroxy-3-methylbut-2-enyl diphosphate reductase
MTSVRDAESSDSREGAGAADPSGALSPTSSNANRLVEVVRNAGGCARLIEHAADIDPAWLADVRAVGVTAGASTPEVLVQDAIACLRRLGCAAVRDLTTAEEHVTFPLPRELRA